MPNFVKLVGLSLLFILPHCKPRFGSSEEKALNATSAGYIIKFQGKIDLTSPSTAVIEQIMTLNHLEGQGLEKITNDDIKVAKQKVKDNFATLKQELDLENPMPWILTQLTYPIYFKDERNSLSVSPADIEIEQPDPKSAAYTYHVKAVLNPSRQFNAEEFRKQPLLFPLNPITIMLDTNQMSENYDLNQLIKDDHKHSCLKTTGHMPAPKNYFYFFNPYFSDCLIKYSDKLVTIEHFELISQKDQPVYPEYDLLFADNVLNVVVMFGSSENDWGFKNFSTFKNFLSSSGFDLTKLATNDYRAKKIITAGNANRTINIRFFQDEDMDALIEKFNNDQLVNHEIIMTSGHAGYGSHLSRLIKSAGSSWPKHKYQIVFLYNCNSFSYATSNVHLTKALGDLDFAQQNYYIDTISTNSAAFFPYMAPTIMAFVRFLEKSLTVYGTSTIADYSYQSLIKILDQAEQEYKSQLTIAGEDNNLFQPTPTFERPQFIPDAINTLKLTNFIDKIFSSGQFEYRAIADVLEQIYQTNPLAVSNFIERMFSNRQYPRQLTEVLYNIDQKLLEDVLTSDYRNILSKNFLSEWDLATAHVIARLINSDPSIRGFVKGVLVDPRANTSLKIRLLSGMTTEHIYLFADDIIQLLSDRGLNDEDFFDITETLTASLDRLDDKMLKKIEELAQQTYDAGKLIALFSITSAFYVKSTLTAKLTALVTSNTKSVLASVRDNPLQNTELVELMHSQLESIFKDNTDKEVRTRILELFVKTGHKSDYDLIKQLYTDIGVLYAFRYTEAILNYLFMAGIKDDRLVAYLRARYSDGDINRTLLVRVGKLPAAEIDKIKANFSCTNIEVALIYNFGKDKISECSHDQLVSDYIKLFTNQQDRANALNRLKQAATPKLGDRINYTHIKAKELLDALKFHKKI